MNELTLIFLLFLILGTGLQIWLSQRHKSYVYKHQNVVPDAFAEKILLEEHQKAATYTLAKTNFSQKMLMIEVLVLLLWTLGGMLELVDQAWRHLEWSDLWTGVAVFISFGLLSSLIDLPSDIYGTFRIEAQFGFNRTSPGLFFTDLLKGLILGLVIGVPFLALILWLMAYAGEFWWVSVWAVWISFSLLMLWLYPTVIAPLFNKFKPGQSLGQANRQNR